DVVGKVILYAKSIGMEFWIYDENGWPSGSADGQVLAAHPDSRRWGLATVGEGEVRPEDRVLCRHEDHVIVARGERGVSPLCRATTDTFLALTHERYQRELPREAFDYVTGFFCDEVDYFPGHLFSEGAVPWCDDFEAYYTEKYGMSPCAELWKLFDTEKEHPDFKIRFWETAGDLIARNFYEPYQAWCERHGKLFTGHLKGEESPYFQLMFSGSCFTQLKVLSLPAIDTLERYHGNHFFPYLLASVAAQQGRVGCLAEAMGGAGWGVAPEHLVDYMLWLAEAGVDRVVLHLGQLVLKARAIRDWPPSVPLHLTWHDAFAAVLAEIRERSEPLLTSAAETPHVLIVTPTRGIMASFRPQESSAINLHDGSGIPDGVSARINADFLATVEACYAAGLRYHVTEERELMHARLEGDALRLGAMTYRQIIIGRGCRFDPDEAALIDTMRARGMLAEPPCVTSQREAGISCVSAFSPKQTPWQIAFPTENQMLIEWEQTSGGNLRATVPMENISAPITLILSDPIEKISASVPVRAADDTKKAFILSASGEALTLEITPSPSQPLPFAWLRGDFAVRATDGFRPFDERQISCNGQFILDGSEKAKHLACGELVSQGLPFFGGLVTAEKRLTLTEAYCGELDFEGLSATAARVSVDGRELGFWWSGHPIALDLSVGEHILSVSAAPSTYNVYGPHRYYLGDCRLTSPETYLGRKGYMDNDDAPEHTLIDTMQFVAFTIDGDAVLRTS
ncbi:MAG: hypothetical protein IJV98_03175, partial [Clostridia bacterium]|nr:hypothetical protein [Clostridia bacterium]